MRFTKDPNATLDYTVDWAAWLDDIGDTISVSTWVIPTGLTLVSQSNTTKKAVAFISGGVVGTTYVVVNRITTVGGRIDDRTIELLIAEQ